MKHYTDFRSCLLEVIHKPGQSWKTASGWGSKNPEGSVEYFENEEQATNWGKGKSRMRPEGSICPNKNDTSCPVKLDDEGNDEKISRKKK